MDAHWDRWRLLWPRHARHHWTADHVPVRLAGDIPWVNRIHVAMLCLVGCVGLLFVTVSFSQGLADIGTVVSLSASGVMFAGMGFGGAWFLRQSFSVVVTRDGVFDQAAASGIWFNDVVQHGRSPVAPGTITTIVLVRQRQRYALVSDDIDVTVQRWGLRLVGPGGSDFPGLTFSATDFPGLTFSARRAGRSRAETAGRFLARVLHAEFSPGG